MSDIDTLEVLKEGYWSSMTDKGIVGVFDKSRPSPREVSKHFLEMLEAGELILTTDNITNSFRLMDKNGVDLGEVLDLVDLSDMESGKVDKPSRVDYDQYESIEQW